MISPFNAGDLIRIAAQKIMTTSNVFCIAGWHFNEDLIKKILSIPDRTVYLVSHKKLSEIPVAIIRLLGEDQILVRPNLGYDWGCYQQFLESGLWREHKRIFFMHDDIEIEDPGFVQACSALLDDHAVIGNGEGTGSVSRTAVATHPYAYAHSSCKPVDFGFEHQTVRGSFFATTREVLDRIERFEVFWDPWKVNIEFGNWSTKASCGKLASFYGDQCFGYLSQTFGRSDYIRELYRGDAQEPGSNLGGWKLKLYDFLKRLSVLSVELYYREREIPFRRLMMCLLKAFLALFSSRI